MAEWERISQLRRPLGTLSHSLTTTTKILQTMTQHFDPIKRKISKTIQKHFAQASNYHPCLK